MIDAETILQKLTDENIIQIVTLLGADRYEDKGDYILFPTICHNLYSEEASMKLYYYKNNKVFMCYTGCGEGFNLYGLIERRFDLQGRHKVASKKDKKNDNDYTFFDVVSFVTNKTKLEITEGEGPIYKNLTKKFKKRQAPELEVYNENILKVFDKTYPIEWLREGITREAMDKFNILFSISRNKIIIPHYDIEGKLIGIRGRALDPDEAEKFGKYAPIKIENITYAHPLSLNLYGIKEAAEGIRKSHKVIIMEGEKSALLGYGYYGNDSNIVASCGNHINKNQLNLILKNFDVNEIIIAYDREHTNHKELIDYCVKMRKLCKKYNQYCTFSYVFDKNNLLELKDAPIDRGKEIFEKLISEREIVM